MTTNRHVDRLLAFIAANVRRRRVELGLTQQVLAAAAGIDATFLQRIERASTNLSVAVLVRLATALRTDAKALLAPAKPVKRRPGRPSLQKKAPRQARRKKRR